MPLNPDALLVNANWLKSPRPQEALGRPDAVGRGHYQPDRFSASLQDNVVPWTS